jgi:hypothetical protein
MIEAIAEGRVIRRDRAIGVTLEPAQPIVDRSNRKAPVKQRGDGAKVGLADLANSQARSRCRRITLIVSLHGLGFDLHRLNPHQTALLRLRRSPPFWSNPDNSKLRAGCKR